MTLLGERPGYRQGAAPFSAIPPPFGSALRATDKPTHSPLFPGDFTDRTGGDLTPAASALEIAVCLCERSLTRVLGSVTLAIDKASKGAWSDEGKVSAVHVWGKTE